MICISITHKNLTAAKRECFACNDEEQIRLADTVAKVYPEAGLVLLMTCNRSEIYMSGMDTDFVWLEQQFADTKKFPVEELKGAAMRSKLPDTSVPRSLWTGFCCAWRG